MFTDTDMHKIIISVYDDVHESVSLLNIYNWSEFVPFRILSSGK